MRIFLAGATGVIGVRLVPLLVADGHVVAGMTRSQEKADGLVAIGAEPVVCDVYDAEALREAVVAFGAETVIHQLTDLPDRCRWGRASLRSVLRAGDVFRRRGADSTADPRR